MQVLIPGDSAAETHCIPAARLPAPARRPAPGPQNRGSPPCNNPSRSRKRCPAAEEQSDEVGAGRQAQGETERQHGVQPDGGGVVAGVGVASPHECIRCKPRDRDPDKQPGNHGPVLCVRYSRTPLCRSATSVQPCCGRSWAASRGGRRRRSPADRPLFAGSFAARACTGPVRAASRDCAFAGRHAPRPADSPRSCASGSHCPSGSKRGIIAEGV